MSIAKSIESEVRDRPDARSDASIAAVLRPVVHAVLGPQLPVRLQFWDGSELKPSGERAAGTLRINSPDAVRRIVWAPNSLGLGRAFVAGDLDADGDLCEVIGALREVVPGEGRVGIEAAPAAVQAVRRLGLLGRPLPPPAEEAKLRGWRHSPRRDAAAISHHYDVGNDFYRLVLGPSMTYSCARFSRPELDLTAAQAAKHDLICRKLGLSERPGGRLLDVGCGWGSMAIHAATHYDVSVVGITISEEQAALARERVADAGLTDRVEIRLQDYRELGGERFDAISSIGMSEHVGQARLARYYEILHGAMQPQGRLVNHAISAVRRPRKRRPTFIDRYVFPDGELIDVADSVAVMEQAGFEVRDVESLREHYARTLRAWVANLEESWDGAVRLAGIARARVWRLYMAGCAVAFDEGDIAIHQVLGVVPSTNGGSGMPPTRAPWESTKSA